VTALRIFFVGGLLSFRALFSFLRPEVYVPSMLVAPIFQILLFVYIGRSAGLESDEFFVIGNAVQYAAIPCIFAMTNTIAGERYQNTLSAVLATPAKRIPLFVGRSLPVIVNGFFVAVFAFAVGGAIVGIHVPAEAVPGIAFVILVSAFACTGLGLTTAAVGLLARDTATLSNIVFGILLVFTGANVALDDLPGWMSTLAQGLPLTHGIEAAREIANGSSLGDVAGLLRTEALIGLAYATAAYGLFRLFETEGRRRASLETY
jgi:ABC-2 type transport system permease protein